MDRRRAQDVVELKRAAQELFKCSVLMFERLENNFLETGQEDPFLVSMRENLTKCNQRISKVEQSIDDSFSPSDFQRSTELSGGGDAQLDMLDEIDR